MSEFWKLEKVMTTNMTYQGNPVTEAIEVSFA
jgi:hypothetical protein